MRLLIIGHSVVDKVNQNGKCVIKPGGIFYTASALRSLKSEDDEFNLITTIDENNIGYFEKVFSSFNLQHSQKINEVLKVDLTVFPDGNRKEVFNNIPFPLKLNSEIDFNNFDGILLNYIAGNDVSLDDLIKLRKNYSGIIFSDVHAMSKICLPDKTRIISKVPDYKKWLNQIDIVQTNEEELQSISEGDNELERAEFILNYKPKILLVTKAEKGAVLYFKENNELKSIKRDAVKSDGQNFVGCGDVFGAYFFYSYIRTLKIQSSFELAVKASGKIISFNGLEDFENFNLVEL